MRSSARNLSKSSGGTSRARARHEQSPALRAHWLLLALALTLTLPLIFALLVFEGWTQHEVDAAKARSPCTDPVPDAAAKGGPVIGINRGGIRTGAMPARTVTLTSDGGPDPVWTPRLLDQLRRLFEGLRKAAGGGGRQLNVSVADPDLRTSKGSAVKSDGRRARALFEALREDRPPG
ncbi:hypothetical protein A4E84_23545 [Streptomyces qaidamensis]|uniref:Uncharacterized protein n=1 Tax=Streptomyces qaidamensis TaxID=1783515 RepID=A0A143C3X7_9ACTN|nr:hypothetical protein A4E84_23545 [Streptomyces qaidamensis]